MADNNLQFNIGGDASEFINAVSKVKKSLNDLKGKTEQAAEVAGKFGDKIVDLIEGSAVFKELDKATSGLANALLQMGKLAKAAFTSIQVGSAAAKTALVSTGVLAIVVALGTIAANW